MKRKITQPHPDPGAADAAFYRLFDFVPIPMIIAEELELDGKARGVHKFFNKFFNRKFLQVIGYTCDDVPDMDAWYQTAYPDPEYRAEVIAAFDRAVKEMPARGGSIVTTKSRVRCKDGTDRWFEIVGGLRDSIKDNYHVIAFLDVTEHKEAYDDLSSNRNLLLSLLEYSPNAIQIHDAAGRYLLVNRQWLVEMNKDPGVYLTEKDVLGHRYHEFFDANHIRQFEQEDRRLLDTGESWETEDVYDTDQGVFTYLSNIFPLLDDSGRVYAFCNISTNITERKRAEAAAREAKEAAEAGTRAKSQFLANMSHEIRTPMNAIIGMGHLLGKTKLDRQQADYLGKINLSASILLQLINDLLDFSKIEAGKLEIESIRFRPEEVLENLAQLVAAKAAERGVEIVYKVAGAVPDVALGDPFRLGQVLLNLVNNAIKFTRDGEVIVSMDAVAAGRGRMNLQFAVQDSGIGIEPEVLKNLFTPFTQADGSTTRRFGGTGLGLAISKNLVELMGGRIWAESRPGTGSVFSFNVECEPLVADEHAGRSVPADLKKARVLVVDDSRNARDVCAGALRDLSFEVATAASAEEGLAMIDDARTGNPFRLVLMDWRLPGMDGLEAGRIIKCHPDAARRPGVVLITAFGQDDVIRQAEAELDGCLLKPISQSTLFDAIISVVAGTAPRAADLAPGDADAPQLFHHDVHALVVDDNTINQEVLIGLLAEAQCRVSVAANGREAVDLVRNGGIDIVFMDIQMPEMDGYEATRAMRTLPGCGELPIIAMTAHALASDARKCLDAGMNDIVTKPVNVRKFFDTLDLWAGRVSKVHGPVAAPGNPRPGDSDALPPELPGIDLRAGLARMGNNANRYRKLLSEFKLDHVATAEGIRTALTSGDAGSAKFLAHALRGVAANLAMPGVTAAAAEIESTLERGKEVTPAELSALVDSIELVLSAIDGIPGPGAGVSPERDAMRRDHAAPASLEQLSEQIRALEEKVNTNDFAAVAALEQLLAEIGAGSDIHATLLRLNESLRRFDYAGARQGMAEIMRILRAAETGAGSGLRP